MEEEEEWKKSQPPVLLIPLFHQQFFLLVCKGTWMRQNYILPSPTQPLLILSMGLLGLAVKQTTHFAYLGTSSFRLEK